MKINEIKDYRDPSFTPPTVQKVNQRDMGNFFVPGGEQDTEPVLESGNKKLRKVLTIVGIVLAVALLIYLGIDTAQNFVKLPVV